MATVAVDIDIDIDCHGGRRLTAAITKDAVTDLGLTDGTRVTS